MRARRLIYDRTNGSCHICGLKLAFSNYGLLGRRRAWEIDHSVPSSRGGSSHGNNLYPACISCNRSKGNRRTLSVRKLHGHTRAPASKQLTQRAQEERVVTGIAAGGLLGMGIASIPGAIFGAIFGAAVGSSIKNSG